MTVGTACSWCHTLNPSERRLCASCGHEAHRPRLSCRCARCSAAREDAARKRRLEEFQRRGWYKP